jgi:Flp pilus assembly protein CpaB
VLGGLLVTVALLGTWWTATSASRPPTTTYLVAAHDVAPGERIQRDDLALVVTDLAPSVRRRSFTEPSAVVGKVALAPLTSGELVQSGSVSDASSSPPAREVSFVVDGDWAAGGSLRAGDRIDLLATYGDGEGSQTVRVLAGALLRRVASSGGDGLGSPARQVLTVALTDPEAMKATVNAARAATVTVVRSTTAKPAPDAGPYRAPKR